MSVSKLKLPPRSKKRSVVLAAQRGARTRKHLSVSKLKLLQRSRKKSVVLAAQRGARTKRLRVMMLPNRFKHSMLTIR